MKIVLMRPHASYLYFNLLEGKVYSWPLPLCTLSPRCEVLRRLLPLGLMKFWIRPTRELHRHANARIYAHISSKSCSCIRTQRRGRGEGAADICVCALCGLVQLPYPGLVLTFGVQHLTFALWAKRYSTPSCNKMNIQMMWQAL